MRGDPDLMVPQNGRCKLTGIMKNAAVSLLIGDTDWMGSSCANTGIYIKNGRAVSINIDAGQPADNTIVPMDIKKDIIPWNPFYNVDKDVGTIHINNLSSDQKDEFFKSLYLIVNRYPVASQGMNLLFKALINRNGALGELLPENEIEYILDKLKSRIGILRDIYSFELEQVATRFPELGIELEAERENDDKFIASIQNISKLSDVEVEVETEAQAQAQAQAQTQAQVEIQAEVLLDPDPDSLTQIQSENSTWSFINNSINWTKLGLEAVVSVGLASVGYLCNS